jgi:hypothetical protein
VWSDNETSIDLLGFQHLTSVVIGIVKNKHLLPATIGIYGDWGGGKSSLIQMVQTELEAEEGVVVLPFNGWLFEGYEDAKTALMGSVLEELLSHRKFLSKANDEVKRLGKRLLRRINVLKVVSALGKFAFAAKTAGLGPLLLGLSGGSDLAAAGKEFIEKAKEIDPEEAKKFLKDQKESEGAQDQEYSLRKSVREFRKDFGELLERSDIKTLVIVIDDLDRCLPDSIIETLEAIKLFLFVERTAFIIGADEELVRYAVRKRFPEFPGDRREVGTAYLEKLIQFPVRVPPLGRSEVETYISLLFTALSGLDEAELKKARQLVTNPQSADLTSPRFNLAVAQTLFTDLKPDLVERLALAQRIAPILGTGMNGNPRQCKRFLNMLLMRLAMAASRSVELSQRVLAKLMLLEYFKPELFKQLASTQSAQGGKPREIARLEQAATGTTTFAAVAAAPDSAAHGLGNGEDGKKKRTTRERVAESESPLSADFQLWLDDPWTHDWLASEPALAAIDLRPYFFFSRDALRILGGAAQRLSVPAQQVLQKLLSESEAVRGNAIKEGERLGAADAAAIFEALANRAREEEDHSRDNSALSALISWSKSRTELRLQLISFLMSIPDTALPINVPTQLVLACKNTEAEMAAKQLVERWAKSAVNPGLAKTADAAVTRLLAKA